MLSRLPISLAQLKAEHISEKLKNEIRQLFDLPDGSYSIVSIQGYFVFIMKKNETLTENLPIQIYTNKMKNRIVLRIKTGCKL